MLKDEGEPETKRKRTEQGSNDSENVVQVINSEEKPSERDQVDEDLKSEQKGGWKTLDASKAEDSVPDTENNTKPLLGQGFGLAGTSAKLVSLKTGTNLAAKPSLFKEENKPEKKLDMFSADEDLGERKIGEKEDDFGKNVCYCFIFTDNVIF